MKHIVNISVILVKYIIVIVAMVVGFFILPIAVLFRESQESLNPESNMERFKWIIV